jgi:hypothetical protein
MPEPSNPENSIKSTPCSRLATLTQALTGLMAVDLAVALPQWQ